VQRVQHYNNVVGHLSPPEAGKGLAKKKGGNLIPLWLSDIGLKIYCRRRKDTKGFDDRIWPLSLERWSL
jgi:hypothetical protein